MVRRRLRSEATLVILLGCSTAACAGDVVEADTFTSAGSSDVTGSSDGSGSTTSETGTTAMSGTADTTTGSTGEETSSTEGTTSTSSGDESSTDTGTGGDMCGDGVVEPPEFCDDNGESATCDDDCTPVACGDGVVNATAGESCDDGGPTASCDGDCTPAECGDTVVNAAAGETCDAGGATANCDGDCTAVACGDGEANAAAGEECDDGGRSASCDDDCSSALCGDGDVNGTAGETCDEGGLTATCDPDCTPVACGDNTVNPAAGEECDEGAPTEFCNGDCTLAQCGDGVTNPLAGEDCDDMVQTATCDADCTFVVCGDFVPNPLAGETCDAGGATANCDADCTAVSCGDGTANAAAGEACDDAGQSAACDDDCTAALCGDGDTNALAGEQCDDSGPSMTCDGDCTTAECGDGTVNQSAGETCDDEGESATCDADCTTASCGDTVINATSGEACDDGGESAACDADCTTAVCGDGTTNVTRGETCDDMGDSIDCDADCTVAVCGDTTLNLVAGETCDDGNMVANDGCSATCEVQAVLEIAAGGEHTCALLDTGNVRCWGRNDRGQLGYGNTDSIGDDELPSTAGDVDVGGAVVQVVAGASHSCALLDDGAVRCWGEGGSGQLGYAANADIGDDEVPSSAGDIDLGGVAIAIAAGANHNCAILVGGTVRCWGLGAEGRLGYGNTDSIGENEVPAMAGDVDIGGVAVQIVAGNLHTCVLLEDGGVRCWGGNGAGQLGYGDTVRIGDDELPSTAGPVDVGGNVMSISAGNSHVCAVLDTGAARCWGSGGNGRLGYGDTANIGNDETPSTAGDVNVGGIVVAVEAAGTHTCALLDDGDVRCWGQGTLGRLGYGDTVTIGDTEDPAIAGDLVLGGDALELGGAYGGHTCAVMLTGGVRCWGQGADGRLGYNGVANIGDDEDPAVAGYVSVF